MPMGELIAILVVMFLIVMCFFAWRGFRQDENQLQRLKDKIADLDQRLLNIETKGERSGTTRQSTKPIQR